MVCLRFEVPPTSVGVAGRAWISVGGFDGLSAVTTQLVPTVVLDDLGLERYGKVVLGAYILLAPSYHTFVHIFRCNSNIR